MDVKFNKVENVAILTINGRVDVANAPKLDNVCKKILEKNEKNVLIDGTQLEFISSAGLRVLLKLAKEIKKNSGALAIAHVNGLVRNILEISGFVELFPMFDNVVSGLLFFQDKH